jgi:membrane protein DedA with SNARE-associated domain
VLWRDFCIETHRGDAAMFVPVDEWLRAHLYGVVLLGTVVDAIGIPFPGRLMLIMVGSFTRTAINSGASAVAVIALAALGTVAGDHLWYLIGRLKGRRLFELYCRLVGLPEPRVKAADRFLRRFGGVALVIGRLTATLRIVLVPVAVSRGMSYGRFLAFDALGAICWAGGLVSLGWAAGAVGAQGGVLATLVIIGAVGIVLVVIGVARRWMSRNVTVSSP